MRVGVVVLASCLGYVVYRLSLTAEPYGRIAAVTASGQMFSGPRAAFSSSERPPGSRP